MMTKRLYYTDSYTQVFETQLLEVIQYKGKPAALLDATYFYPTSGGQPNDLGTLNGVAVVDVITQLEDNAVLHILEKPLDGRGEVRGEIDWSRRFDHMQQHTGQHILSRAFELVRDASTIGFHLSENSVTIDLDQEFISPADLDAAEDLANRIVMENHPVRAWFPDEEELAALALRKLSEKVSGAVRVVAIGDFDSCACGGTHVARTGEIGIVKIIRAEKMKKGTRVEFRCGGRALIDYREKNNLLLNLAAEMTIGYWEIPDAFGRLQNENKSLSKALKAANSRLLQYEADALWNAAYQVDVRSVVIAQVWENRDVADVNGMVQYLSQQPKTVILMGIAGEKGHLVFGCSADIQRDMAALLRSTLEKLGSKSGGGRPTLAQGGGFSATPAQLDRILEDVKTQLLHE